MFAYVQRTHAEMVVAAKRGAALGTLQEPLCIDFAVYDLATTMVCPC